MSRYTFGQSSDAAVVSPKSDTDNTVELQPGALLTFWDAGSGGSQYSDFLDTDGVTVVGPSLVSDELGLVPEFRGPDGVAFMYVEVDGAGARVRIPGQWLPASGISDATTTEAGVVELADDAETAAMADDAKAITPAGAASLPFLKDENNSVTLEGADGVHGDMTVHDDGTTQTSWPERARWLFGAVKTFAHDKYGQARAYAAKASTVPLRAMNLNATPTANLLEVAKTETGPALGGFTKDGWVFGPNVGVMVTILEVSDPVPSPAVGSPPTLYMRKVS